jgi:hypothetical protein
MRVAFRPYTPRRGSLDTAASLWSTKEGDVCAIEQPAYAVYDTANLVSAFERHFGGLQLHIEDWIYSRIQNDEIAVHTYREVLRMQKVHGSKALGLAMRLQCLSVVSQGYGTVWTDNIPGIQEYDYRRFGTSDYEAYDRNSRDRPLPGAITHQMDVAAVKYLRKLEKEFVKELASLIFKPKIKPWYELFLTFYVIFWNLEYINGGAKGYMKAKNGTVSHLFHTSQPPANLVGYRAPSQQRGQQPSQEVGVRISCSTVSLAVYTAWVFAFQACTRQSG